MDEPLVVPGHPVDNPPTDDFWPHLSPELDPLFYSDDGSPAGPIQTIGAQWRARSAEPGNVRSLPLIPDALLALTDSRLIAMGRAGVDSPPDRRLVTQFRFVWCSALEWEIGGRTAPSSISLFGLSQGEALGQGESLIERKFSFQLPPGLDARALAQDMLRRIAGQYLRMDLADPSAVINQSESEGGYLRELSETTIDPSELRATVPFPRFRWIRYGDGYRLGGPEVRAQMVHAQLAAR